MTEPSEAAKRKACELAGKEYYPFLFYRYSLADSFMNPTLVALARVLQEHSDVAKRIRRNCGRCEEFRDWQSLILHDEPLDDLTVVEGYQLQPDGTRARVRVALRDMRIVEDKGDD